MSDNPSLTPLTLELVKSFFKKGLQPYAMDLNLAWQWVGPITKSRVVNILLDPDNCFQEDKDYTGSMFGDGGIRITRKCFKKLCLLSGTEGGKEAREQFIAFEDMLKEENNGQRKAVLTTDLIPLTEQVVKTYIESESQFPVDFERAWQWIGYANKASAKRQLVNPKNKLVLGTQYQSTLVLNSPITASKPVEEIFLTRKCFKKLCMLSKTEMGDQSREYFIECEEKLKEARSETHQQLPKLTLREALLLAAEIEAKNEQLLIDNAKLDEEKAGLKNEARIANLHLKEATKKLQVSDDVFKAWKKLKAADPHGTFLLDQVCATFVNEKVGKNLLLAYMRKKKILKTDEYPGADKNGKAVTKYGGEHNLPYSNYRNVLATKIWTDDHGHKSNVVLVKTKGLPFILKVIDRYLKDLSTDLPLFREMKAEDNKGIDIDDETDIDIEDEYQSEDK